ncbi:MAG: hypothetical protein RQ839_05330 [Thermoproteus sp.]|jgi:hypothetical protein|nr:hypothetical protein [Thermoproteus sp.]MDT7881504.1 hypothetical protein [Thermoproteus sp.]
MRRLAFIAYLLVIWTSFTGALTAGLGQGFDLGTAWPGALSKFLAAVASGSFEPIHRFSTVAAGLAVFAAAVWYRRDEVRPARGCGDAGGGRDSDVLRRVGEHVGPGAPDGPHAMFAHLMATISAVAYLKARRVG